MSFRRACRIALDDTRPLGLRYLCVRRAGELYAWLTETSFESVFVHLGERHGFRVGLPNTSETIAAAAAALDASRDEVLARLDAYRRARRLDKRAGRRSPTAVERRDLYRDPPLGVLRSWSHGRAASPIAEERGPFMLAPGLPPPELTVGDMVSVRLGERNITPRSGRVRALVWHFKLERWCFYLEVNGRTIHKRYFADDLERSP